MYARTPFVFAPLALAATLLLSTLPALARPDVSLETRLDRTHVLRGADRVARMEVVIRGGQAGATAQPVDLVVLMDVSGSMTGEKLSHAKAALRALASWVGPRDRLALLPYNGRAWTALAPSHGTRANARHREAVIDGLRAGGSTRISAALDLGVETVREVQWGERVARLVIVSDGLANQGDTSLLGLGRRARASRLAGANLSAVGVGLHFNEALLATLADEGAGQFHYVEDPEGLEERFASEFRAARRNVARAVSLRVKPTRGVRLLDAAGYPIDADGDTLVIHPGPLASGQERRFWLTFQAPAGVAGPFALAELRLRYRDPQGGDDREVRAPESRRLRSTPDPSVFESGLDREAWARGVASQVYGQLLEDVAHDLRSRDAERAARRIEDFEERYLARAERLGIQGLAEVGQRLQVLRDEVAAARRGEWSAEDHSRGPKRYIDRGRLTRGR